MDNPLGVVSQKSYDRPATKARSQRLKLRVAEFRKPMRVKIKRFARSLWDDNVQPNDFTDIHSAHFFALDRGVAVARLRPTRLDIVIVNLSPIHILR